MSENSFKKIIKKRPDSLKILTEGDSWFHLPIGKNIIDYIEDLSDYNILRTENSGDEIMQIMSGSQKVKLRRLLKEYEFDFLLFSAGGNDMIGSDMDELLQKSPYNNWESFLMKDRFEKKIKMIELIYKDLINIRDDYSPKTVIMADCYDYIIPSNVPTKLFRLIPISGPWVKPMLEAHECYNPENQKKIIKYMIDSFADMLKNLSKTNKNFVFLDTRGIVGEKEWQDEIHPSRSANKKIAQLFIENITRF